MARNKKGILAVTAVFPLLLHFRNDANQEVLNKHICAGSGGSVTKQTYKRIGGRTDKGTEDNSTLTQVLKEINLNHLELFALITEAITDCKVS
jgi:hypothetical protein